MKTVFKIFVMVIVIAALACTMVACFNPSHVHKISQTTMVSKEATCNKSGEGYMYCVECGEQLNKVVIPATGEHRTASIPGYAATCNKDGLTDGEKCKDCGEIIVEQTKIPATNSHNSTVIAGYSATCSSTGLTEGSKCADCGVILTEQTIIPVNNTHVNTEVVTGYPATCVSPGLSDGTKCSDCNTVIVEPTVLPTNDTYHINTETILGYAATCSNTGLSDGMYCHDCNKVVVEPVTIPTNDNHTPETMPDVPPTCSTVGATGGEKCKDCGVIVTQPTEVATTDHTPGNWTVVNEESYATFNESHLICAHCPAVLDTRLSPPTVTEGLEYTLNANGTGYIVTGRGTNERPYINIADMYLGLPVVGIDNNAFQDDLYILGVYVPTNVTYIGNNAFANCKNIETVWLPMTLNTIGNNAFNGCLSIINLTIPAGVTSIGEKAFENCSSLTTLTIESKTIELQARCFGNNTALTTLKVYADMQPMNLTDATNMNDVAFANCIALTTVDFFDNACPDMMQPNILNDIIRICNAAQAGYEEGCVRYLGSSENKYLYCIGVTNYYSSVYAIQEGAIYIGPNAFKDCTFAVSVYIPTGVTHIADYAFANMNNVTEITLPGTLVYIAPLAFDNSWPEKITFKGTLEQWDLLPGHEYFDYYYNEKVFN